MNAVLKPASDIPAYMRAVGLRARAAARAMARASTASKDAALIEMAAAIRRDKLRLQSENAKDLDAGRAKGLDAAMLDRLTLSDKAIETMAQGLEQIASLGDPVGAITDMKFRPNVFRMRQRWFKKPYPADTLVGVKELGRPERWIEIDATALARGRVGR